MAIQYTLVLMILIAGMVWSGLARKLTWPGAIAGALIGFLVFASAGFTGLMMMAAFFLMGTAATSWKREVKEKLEVTEENSHGRTAGQVVANAGVGALLGICVLAFPGKADLLRMMMAASFSSAAADTLASELGNVYGKRYYHILTFKRDSRGLNGVVSLEGTVCGIAGSGAIAIVYACGFGWNANLLVIILAGTFGNLMDSVLGATLERRRFLHNDAVNFLNTLLAALAAWAMRAVL